MSTSTIPFIGYTAALINGQWKVQPVRTSQSPLEQILQDIERALAKQFYYLAIMMALALPDVCSCLESPLGDTRGRVGAAYRAWFKENLASKFSNFTDSDAYKLRCGVVHQGHFGDDPKATYDRIVFLGPNRSLVMHDIVVTIEPGVQFGGIDVGEHRLEGRILHFDVVRFCGTMIDAVRTWAAAKASDPDVQKNLPNLVRYRPEGMPPYIVGVPLIV